MMKTNFLKTLLFFLIIGLVVTSCNKDDDTPAETTTTTSSNSNSTTETYIITLTKDDDAQIKYTEGSATMLADKIIIGANNSDSDIQFSINSDIEDGVYTSGYIISHGVNSVAVFSTGTNVQSSTLTISTHDVAKKHIEGAYTVNYTDNNDQSTHTAKGSIDIIYN